MEKDEFLAKATAHVIKKKDLKEIDEEFAGKAIRKIFSEESRESKKLSGKVSGAESFEKVSKSREYGAFFKRCRKELREKHGMFQKMSASRDFKEMLRQLGKSSGMDKKEMVEEILKSHTSTSERISHYEEIFDFCFVHA